MENEIKEVEVSPFAQDDLNEIIEYYASISLNYIETTISEFEENVMSLQQHPRSGRIVPELERQGITQYRELIQGYYSIVFYIIRQTIVDDMRQVINVKATSSYIGSYQQL